MTRTTNMHSVRQLLVARSMASLLARASMMTTATSAKRTSTTTMGKRLLAETTMKPTRGIQGAHLATARRVTCLMARVMRMKRVHMTIMFRATGTTICPAISAVLTRTSNEHDMCDVTGDAATRTSVQVVALQLWHMPVRYRLITMSTYLSSRRLVDVVELDRDREVSHEAQSKFNDVDGTQYFCEHRAYSRL